MAERVFRKASFLQSAAMASQRAGLSPLPEIAICGRSNVGKSTLINGLCGNWKLARTSKTPGCTRLINTFLIEDAFYLVDLPGYGFASVSRKMQEEWGNMAPEYLLQAKDLRLVLLLIDFRHPPTNDDVKMMAFLQANGFPTCVVATKADQVPRGKRHKAALEAAFKLKVTFMGDILPVSAQSGEGLQRLADIMKSAAQEPKQEA